MFVTPLNIEQVLDRFYNQNKYELMLLFVSSFDGKDRFILKEIVDNAKRIDRITEDRICFFYFIQDTVDSMNETLTRWVKKQSDWKPLYGEGVSVTMETVNDICRHFSILRSSLPAFILVGKNRREEPQIFSIHKYNDFESFLTPLNILHAYVDDRKSIISRYENEKRRRVVTQEQVDERNEQRHAWFVAIERQERKKAKELSLGLTDKANEREIEIQKFYDRLVDYPELKLQGEDESVVFPQQELDFIRKKCIEKLNVFLNSNDGESMIDKLASSRDYLNAILKIWESARTRSVRISRIIENIRYQICEHGFDIFISCKSQDYALAHELYDYLAYNGFKPFLADTSIKEVGIDQYTALIGEVINACRNMIVFVTNPDYIETPYVAAEWHTFVNDINTGHKSNAKLVTIIAPNIDVRCLPALLRDKQSFTTDNYKDSLLKFLKGQDNCRIQQLRDKTQNAYCNYLGKWNQLYSTYKYRKLELWYCDFIYHLERDKERITYMLKEFEKSYNYRDFEFLQMETNSILQQWGDEYCKIVNAIKKVQEDEESKWHETVQIDSEEAIKLFLEQFPDSIYAQDARNRLKYYLSSALQEDAIVFDNDSCSKIDVVSDINNDGEIEEVSDFDSLSNEIQDVLSDEGVYVCNGTNTFEPNVHQTKSEGESIFGMWKRLFKRRELLYDVFSSIFAPAEVRPKSHVQIQVYLHLYEETEKVKALAQESQREAERRDYIPLQCKLKKGDKVDVYLNIYGEMLLMSDKKSVVWQGSFTKCSFDYFVSEYIDVDELSCMARLTVNEVPVGEMRFITKIVDRPRQLNPEIIVHKYNKVFISYAHKDEVKVRSFHEGLKLAGIDHFFDRKYLKAGDIFPKVIEDYINSADLFVLFWSENAAKSDYVEKERKQALLRAFPQVKPQEIAKLSIYPMSIEPNAELPDDMKDYYHFGEM